MSVPPEIITARGVERRRARPADCLSLFMIASDPEVMRMSSSSCPAMILGSRPAKVAFACLPRWNVSWRSTCPRLAKAAIEG